MKRLALIALVLAGCAAAPPSTPSHLAFLTPDPTEEDASEPTPAAKPKPAPPSAVYAKLTARSWALLVKSPDKYTGNYYVLWACITQFDAATGSDTFRGQASFGKQSYWFSEGDNAFFTGSDNLLEQFVVDDVVLMNVTAGGALSYDTQIGGNTTVPAFRVDKITRKGSCA